MYHLSFCNPTSFATSLQANTFLFLSLKPADFCCTNKDKCGQTPPTVRSLFVQPTDSDRAGLDFIFVYSSDKKTLMLTLMHAWFTLKYSQHNHKHKHKKMEKVSFLLFMCMLMLMIT